MSLITLNSNGQSPFLFTNHFPQPIKIPPNSQVCLLKFLHFRDSSVYNITSSNNTLRFVIGNTSYDATRVLRLIEGQYSGAEFATQLALQFNQVTQQQNYSWGVTFVTEDPTTSPPTPEGFIIVLTTLPSPAINNTTPLANMVKVGADLQVVTGLHLTAINCINDTILPENATLSDNLFTAIEPKGLLTDDGSFTFENIGFDFDTFYDTLPFAQNLQGFNSAWFGVVRDELSNLDADIVSARFNPDLQDVSVRMSATGLQVSTINIAGGGSVVGSPNYATRKSMRELPKANLSLMGFTTQQIPNVRFKIVITTKGKARKFIGQIFLSTDLGKTYSAIADGTGGNDTGGNGDPYIVTYQSFDGQNYPSTFWVSDLVQNNDAGGYKTNMLQTRKAPYKATATLGEQTRYLGPVILDDGDATYITGGGVAAGVIPYTGAHGYDYKIEQDGAEPDYYLVSNHKRFPATNENMNAWSVSLTDVAFAPADVLGTGLWDIVARTFTIVDTATPAVTTIFSPDNCTPTLSSLNNQEYFMKGVLNPNDRAVSLANYEHPDGRLMTDLEIHQTFLAGEGDNNIIGLEDGSVGADLQRPVSLLLRTLTQADVAANSGAPLNLKVGAQGGTMGGVLGSNDNIVFTDAGATPLQVFVSDNPTQKISKDTIINVSIPEFAGLKSFNGIDQQAGKNLSGEGKVLAVLPREEFALPVQSGGSLVYVAPFENWLDVNNGQELSLNQMSVEVRTLNGQMASDLRPDTICQIKMRKHPDSKNVAQYERYNDRILAQASAQDTGQNVMNNLMPSTGS